MHLFRPSLIFTDRLSQRPKEPRKIRDLVVGIESARVRQDPHRGAADPFVLTTQHRIRREGLSVRSDAEKCDADWAVTGELSPQSSRAGHELGRRDLVGPRGCTLVDVGQADPVLDERTILARRELPRSETGSVKRGPEPVAGSGEVMPDRSGVKTRIDATEQHPQPVPDHIGNRLAPGRFDFLAGRLPNCNRLVVTDRSPRPESRRAPPRCRHATLSLVGNYTPLASGVTPPSLTRNIDASDHTVSFSVQCQAPARAGLDGEAFFLAM